MCYQSILLTYIHLGQQQGPKCQLLQNYRNWAELMKMTPWHRLDDCWKVASVPLHPKEHQPHPRLHHPRNLPKVRPSCFEVLQNSTIPEILIPTGHMRNNKFQDSVWL